MDSSPPDLLELCNESLARAKAAGAVDEQLRSLQAALRLARAACRIALDHAAAGAVGARVTKIN